MTYRINFFRAACAVSPKILFHNSPGNIALTVDMPSITFGAITYISHIFVFLCNLLLGDHLAGLSSSTILWFFPLMYHQNNWRYTTVLFSSISSCSIPYKCKIRIFYFHAFSIHTLNQPSCFPPIFPALDRIRYLNWVLVSIWSSHILYFQKF